MFVDARGGASQYLGEELLFDEICIFIKPSLTGNGITFSRNFLASQIASYYEPKYLLIASSRCIALNDGFTEKRVFDVKPILKIQY
jgi:hypothetical protein